MTIDVHSLLVGPAHIGPSGLLLVLLAGVLAVLLVVGLLRRLVLKNRQLAESLKERDRMWREMTRNVPVFIYRCRNDEDWTMLYMSEGCERLTGYPAKDFIQNRRLAYNDVIHPDWREQLRKHWQREMEAKGEWEFDYPIIHADGSECWVWERARAVTDVHGDLAYIEGVITDITERKKAEEDLYRSEERARRQRSAYSSLALAHSVQSEDLTSVLRKVAYVMGEAMQVARTSIWWLSPDGTQLTCATLYDAARRAYSSGQMLKADEYPHYFHAIRREGRVYAHDARHDVRTSEFLAGYLKPNGITSMLDAGIAVDGELRGIVCLEHVGPMRHWTADEEGFVASVSALIGQYLAVSSRLVAERKLASMTEEYQSLVELIKVGLFIADDDENGMMRFVYVSPRICEMLDMSAADLYANAERAFEIIHPDEVARFMALDREAAANVTPFVWEGRAIPGGRERWFRVQSSPKRMESGKLYWFGLVEDITAHKEIDAERLELLKKAEESRRVLLSVLDDEKSRQVERDRLAHAIEQAGETVLITDPQGTIQYVNPAFEKITGYTKEEVVGGTPRVLKSGQQTEEYYRQLWDTISSGRVWTGRLVNRKKNGELYTEDATISPVLDADGRIVNYVAVKRDITNELHVQRQLLQSQKIELVGQLAGGVAHDFNNLLQSIMGFTELALEEVGPEDRLHEYLSEVQKSANSASALTRQLLTFSRRQVSHQQPLNLNEQLQSVHKMLGRIIGESIKLELDLEDGLGPVVADPGQIEQVLMNLAVNARDAMPDGGTIRIATSQLEVTKRTGAMHPSARPGRYAHIAFSDTGIGMTDETLSHIFEPFFTTKPSEKGTGLELSTVYGIIQQHQGWITVGSKVNEGTTFDIFLPLAGEDAAVPDKSPTPPVARHRARGERVLLVEDEQTIRQLMTRILTDSGFIVWAEATAEDALQRYEQEKGRIDILFTDIVLPKRSGFDLAEELTQRDSAIKILLTSGYTDERARWQQIQSKGWHFIQKPISRRALLKAMDELLAEP